MKRVRRLDAGHIQRACAHAMGERSRTEGTSAADVRVTEESQAVRVRVADPVQREAALVALRQLGYQIARREAGRPLELTVTGWAFAELAARAVHLDEAAEALSGAWRATAVTAIDVYRHASGDVRPGLIVPARTSAIGATTTGLVAQHLADSGPRVPHDPSVRPHHPRTTQLLGAVWRLEDRVDELLKLHRTVAFDAVTRYAAYAERLTRQQAFRRAANESAQRVLDRLPGPVDQPAESPTDTPHAQVRTTPAARRRARG